MIPEIVYELGRPNSTVPKDEQIQGQVELSATRARELATQPTLYGVEDEDAKVYGYAKHFRRQLKARLLKDRIVTQIVRETTLVPEEFVGPSGRPQRRVEDSATIAWKLGTGSFTKLAGTPATCKCSQRRMLRWDWSTKGTIYQPTRAMHVVRRRCS